MVKSTNLAIPGHFVKGHNLMHCILLLEDDDVQYVPAVPVWGFLSLTTSLLLMLQLEDRMESAGRDTQVTVCCRENTGILKHQVEPFCIKTDFYIHSGCDWAVLYSFI